MNIRVVRVKQYNSTYKNVVMANNEPICIIRGKETTSKIISYLEGYNVKINDGKIKKKLDKILEMNSRGEQND